jgi:endonuclease/exonuclease/phosphatase family metal-dependent hydrolase
MPQRKFRSIAKKIFIVCNYLTALLFLVASYGYLVNPEFFWPVGLLTLSAFYLLMLLLVFIIFWLFIRPRYTFISLCTLVIAIKPLKELIPFRFSSTFTKEKKTGNLRIMSWNVAQFDVLNYKKHPEIKTEMMEIINENQPDIACFQEMVCADSPTDTTTAYYKKYSYFSLEDFSSRLQYPHSFYSYNVKENYLDNQHFGIITFSKYPIINQQTVSYYPNDYNSIFQYSDIIKDSDTLRVFNIHLQSLRFSPKNLQYLDKPDFEDDVAISQGKSIFSKLKKGFLKRKIQADRIHAEVNKSPYPVIICGDFNDVPNSYAYHTIGQNMQNSFVQKGVGIGRTYSGISPTLRIDNIFVSKPFRVQQYTRITKKLSDHFPVITDIEVKK